MTHAYTYRLLTVEDVEIFRSLRLYGLQEAPRSFLEDYEETKDKPLPYFAKFFSNGWIVGAFLDDTLIGISGLYIHRGKKLQHKGTVWGVYTLPEHRGCGLAKTLITMLLKEAAAFGLEHVTLSVDEANPSAIAAYTRLGFKEYGREKNFMKVGGNYINEIMMAKPLKDNA